MANIVTLHKRQLFLSDGTVAKYARVSFSLNHTTTQLSVFSDPSCDVEFERSQPVICDGFGVLPVCYTVDVAAFRILATDQNDVPLDGYGDGGMDDITPEPTDGSGASTTSFNPTAAVPVTNVQAAIELVSSQIPVTNATDTFVWTTGGTGNAYTLTPTPAITGYATGRSYWIRPDRANTGAVTINVSGLGTRSVYKTNSVGTPVALTANDLAPYSEAFIAYDGSVFRILSQRNNSTSGSGATGTWDMLSSGLLICSGTIEVTFSAVTSLFANWVFPHVFIGPPASATCFIVGGSNPNTPGTDAQLGLSVMPINNLQSPIIGPRTSNSMSVRIYRISSVLSFASTDSVWCVVSATGRGA